MNTHRKRILFSSLWNAHRHGIGTKHRLSSCRRRDKLGRICHGNPNATLAGHAFDIERQLPGTRRRIVARNNRNRIPIVSIFGQQLDCLVGRRDRRQHAGSLIRIDHG